MEKENLIDGYTCGRANDIVSYIYNEIGPGERQSFEVHLANCVSCTDEFAAVSDARFSVFEWHKEEFVDLPTPHFSIPYAPEPQASTGLFSSLAAIVQSSGWAIPAAAVVLLCVGVAAYLISTANTNSEIALSEADRQETAVNGTSVDTRLQDDENEAAEADPILPDEAEPPISESIRPQPPAVRSIKRVSSKAKPPRASKAPVWPVNKPVLGSYEPIEDKSLRLSDLLDEVGG